MNIRILLSTSSYAFTTVNDVIMHKVSYFLFQCVNFWQYISSAGMKKNINSITAVTEVLLE